MTAVTQQTPQLDETTEEILETHPLVKLRSRIDLLSENQERFLVAKLYGTSDAAAARAAGIQPATAYEWKKDPEFKNIYDDVIARPVEYAAEVSAYGLAKAINKLVGLLDHQSIKVVQYAIDKLVEIGGLNKTRIEVTKKDESIDFDRAIRDIESRQRQGADSTGDSARIIEM